MMHSQNKNQNYRRRRIIIRQLEDNYDVDDATSAPSKSTTSTATTITTPDDGNGLLTPGERIGVTIGLIILLLIGLYSMLMLIRIRRRRRPRPRTTGSSSSKSGSNWTIDTITNIFGVSSNYDDEDGGGGSFVTINRNEMPATVTELPRTYDTSSSSSSSSSSSQDLSANKNYLPHHYQIDKNSHINKSSKRNALPAQKISIRRVKQQQRNKNIEQQQQNQQQQNSVVTGISTTRSTGMPTITNDNNVYTPTTTATAATNRERNNDTDSSNYTTSSSAYMTNNEVVLDLDMYNNNNNNNNNKRNGTFSPMYESSSVAPSSTPSFSLASVVLNSMLPKGAHHIMKDEDDGDNNDYDIESNVYYRHQDGNNGCSSPKQQQHPFDEDSSGNGGDGDFNASRSTTTSTTTGIGFKSCGPNHGYDVFAGIIEQKKRDKERGIDECDYYQKEEEEDSVFDGIQ